MEAVCYTATPNRRAPNLVPISTFCDQEIAFVDLILRQLISGNLYRLQTFEFEMPSLNIGYGQIRADHHLLATKIAPFGNATNNDRHFIESGDRPMIGVDRFALSHANKLLATHQAICNVLSPQLRAICFDHI